MPTVAAVILTVVAALIALAGLLVVVSLVVRQRSTSTRIRARLIPGASEFTDPIVRHRDDLENHAL